MPALQYKHYEEEHNVPSGDEILNRYVDLHFSTFKNVDLAKKENMMLRLLKLLKERVSYNALAQEKVKLDDANLDSIFDKFINVKETGSTSSIGDENSLSWQRYELVKWFLTRYGVFTNKCTYHDLRSVKDSVPSFFTSKLSRKKA